MGWYGWSRDQIEQLHLPPLHDTGFKGEGVRIGVVDTGFLLSHRAFSNPEAPIRVVAQWDFVDNDSVTAPEAGDYPDQHEHGTLVLGTMAANRPGELVGSAPEAEYLLLKAEDAATEYFLEEKWFAAALEFAESRGADVITSSTVLYTGYDARDVDGRTSIMAQAWAIAVENGVVGFQGAGNSGHDGDPNTHHLLPPAGAPGVISVGAVDTSGTVAPFSSDGGKIAGMVRPELMALGRSTASVSPYEKDRYTTAGGTSMATPLLAGAVACLLQARPEWSMEDLKEALRQSGSYYREHGESDPLYVWGFGIPDLERAARWKRAP
jgi:subtilisin family serine protease